MRSKHQRSITVLSLDDQRRLAQVEWRDLVALSRKDVFHQLTLSLPSLAISLMLASCEWSVPALVASFAFFLAGLRQGHNAYHQALGLSRRATEVVMFVLTVLMLGTMHAIRIDHLHHHRNCFGDDVEAMSTRLPPWGVLLLGPWFPLRLHHGALQLAWPTASLDRRRPVGERCLAPARLRRQRIACCGNTASRWHPDNA